MTRDDWKALLLPLALATAACSGGNAESKQPPRKPPPVPVAVAPVERKSFPLQIQAIGSVEAYQVVAVRAQVGGELVRVHIKEGQDVRKGDPLFTIDPRTYEAALAQAQAKNAEVSERRYRDLLARELISQEQYDQIKTTYESLAATVRADEADVASAQETVRADEANVRSAEEIVKADEANVANVRVQLGYTQIRAPIDGRTGSLQLNLGNVVRAGGTSDSTLLVINQLQPIYVSFTVPQQQLPQIKRYMAEGTLTVDALPSGESKPERGTVTFIDNAVDQTTGTIRLKATFANTERHLWPGQFASVTLTLAVEPDTLVIPAQALQSGPQGTYVFVVKPDTTVETRRVVVTRTQGSESVVTSGLSAGESIVTDGQPRLVQGAKVEVRGAPGRPGGAGGPRGAPAGAPPRPAGAPTR